MKASHRRILRWLLGVSAAVVLVGALLVANIAAQLSGGWDEVFDRSHPMPGDAEVVAAREVGAATVDAEIARVIDEVVVPDLTEERAAQPALAGAEAMTDRGVGLDSGCEWDSTTGSATIPSTCSACSPSGRRRWRRCVVPRGHARAAPGPDRRRVGAIR